MKGDMKKGDTKKIDVKKVLKPLYQPSAAEVTEAAVPPMTYLMIDGQGDPNTSKAFAAAVEALFAAAYAIKFAVKKGPTGADYGVMPLEGLWWADDMSNFAKDRSRWEWTLMVMQPSFATRATMAVALADVKAKKDLPALSDIRVGVLKEGRCAQVMHVGPFSQEGPTIERLHRFIADKGRRLSGRHHEIYLSDMRRTAPSRWKTIIRQPMR